MTLATTLVSSTSFAVDADPSTYESIIPTLMPGDTLTLAAGTYTGNLDISNLNGSEGAPITIVGPADKSAVFIGNPCCNTVELVDSSYVVLQNLTVDGQGLDGVFGVSAKDGEANTVHHITIEGCVFVGQGASQQTVAISTKTPTWGWVIRGNLIDGAGTGMYLGNSDGTMPFVDGVIDGNLVRNTVGYNMQIKFQLPWPAGTGLPTRTTTTVIRNNVFIKNDDPSPDGDRPNVLVGGFPESGPGSDDQYEIYGNFFFHNPREAHLQASGRASIHDNVLVDAVDASIVVTDHDLPLRRAHVYNNTIYAVARGIRFGNAASEGDFVVGNLIFGNEGVTGPAVTATDNLLFTLAEASSIVASPSTDLGSMDFYPLAGQAQGAPLDLSAVASDSDYALDFNGTSKGDFRFRGAYAGEGSNPGWQLADDFKQGGPIGEGGAGGGPSEGGASAMGGGPTNDTGGSANGGASATDDGGAEEGCSCGFIGARTKGAVPRLFVLGLLVAARRRPRRPRDRGLA